ncbi:MAG TPA: WecB/TagA/CpsF family glycosyltransferase [Dictyobacter sp.]|jgi:N-acetylglucosaminyldiphosphoundecaprenol N-acetyl-beta-D-mannosaminyltransferase|nr:WecB/TagA/CpsF family glycosyltransferase [Dictyobacter sp.]
MIQTLHTLQPEKTSTLYILGVRVDRVTQQQVVAATEAMIDQYHASVSSPVCQQIVTVNPEFVVAAQRNVDFRLCINKAALVTADGVGIVLASRYLRRPVPERVTGIDTVVALAKMCAERDFRLYLLGAAPGVAEEAADRLRILAPGLQIVGTYSGSPARVEEDEIIERIREAQADLVCVAYGAPAQDLWIARNLSRLPAAIAMGVGGTFDFLAGRQQRAPRIFQRSGMEWVYRLYREPWRWKRMLALPKFAVKVLLKGRHAYGA